jgi:secondary thiamine-phosphate synthase enzyme
MVLVSAMHISASVFVNDHEPGLWADILDWLEQRVAPWHPDAYRHNSGTGEDNAAAHLRSLTVGHEVIVPVTEGRLDFGPWQRVFYGEWDGQRKKRVVIKALGECGAAIANRESGIGLLDRASSARLTLAPCDSRGPPAAPIPDSRFPIPAIRLPRFDSFT